MSFVENEKKKKPKRPNILKGQSYFIYRHKIMSKKERRRKDKQQCTELKTEQHENHKKTEMICALECIAGSVFYIAPVVLIKLSFIVRRYSKTINQVMVASVNISKGQPQLYNLQPILLRMSGYEMLALEYQKSITKILN